jgi:uncharacterized protein (TIGR03435 family)
MMLPVSVLLLCQVLLSAQIAAPSVFEVAAVKPTQHGRTADGWSRSSVDIPSPGRFVAQNSSLSELIRFAYQVKEYQISGPIWLNDDSECFDIAAKAPPETPKPQMREMLQALLAERFKLTLHRESRTLPLYNLLPTTKGPKLQPAASPTGRSSTNSSGGNVTASNISMTDFAYQLSRWLSRPVRDKTGIKGTFDLTLRYDERDSSDRPSLFAALQEQLGLRLQPAKGPVEILVIDQVAKTPTDN